MEFPDCAEGTALAAANVLAVFPDPADVLGLEFPAGLVPKMQVAEERDPGSQALELRLRIDLPPHVNQAEERDDEQNDGH